jgi:hypothetical protein
MVGTTPNLPDAGVHSPSARRRECEAWIAANDPGAPWITLEDAVYSFDADCPNLSVCRQLRIGL